MNMNRNFVVVLFLLLALPAASLTSAQAPDYSGTWAGVMNRPSGPAGLELVFARAGEGWKATMKMRVPNGDLTPTVEEVKIAGADISFSATVANGVLIKFKGKFEGDKLSGTFESTRGETKVGEGTIAGALSPSESF